MISSSVASLLPSLIFSFIVISKRKLSWDTKEIDEDNFSRDKSFVSTFPIFIDPLSTFQNPAISFAIVDLPDPEGPTRAETEDSFISIERLSMTFFSPS